MGPEPARWSEAIEILDLKPMFSENTLKSLLDAFNRHDLDEVRSFFTDHSVLEMPRGSHP